jgi:hypothetical protein
VRAAAAPAPPPQFALYNAVLRRWPKGDSECGNLYTTTAHVLVSGVLKLARVTKFPEGMRVYRGTGGRMALPLKFYQADECGRKGFTEWAFMSTTVNRAVAEQYSGVREGHAVPTVLVINVTSVDRGADIASFSQYTGEGEVLFAPMSFLAPDGPAQLEVTAHGIVSVVPLRVNVNLTMSTLEELIGRRKSGHVASFGYLIADMRRELLRIAEEGGAEQRLARDPVRVYHEVTHTVDGLVDRSVGLVEEVRAAHEGTDAEVFTRDAAYKGLVTEMLDAAAMAQSPLRLYLEDKSRDVVGIMEMSLLDAHRALAAFRARGMRALEGDARREAALLQCQGKGLVVERIDEASRAGETPLVRAAADGTVGPAAMALLIEAGAGVGDGKALGGAAEHGNVEAVVALLGAKAPVDSVAVEVMDSRENLTCASAESVIRCVPRHLTQCCCIAHQMTR